MADTVTPKLALTKPEIGASNDTWGNKLNENFNIIDAKVLANTNQWTVTIGDGVPTGGWFYVTRLNNSAVKIDDPLVINRQNGDVTIANNLSVSKSITAIENITATGNVSGNNVTAIGTVSGVNVTASGTITGTVSAPNANVSGTINSGAVATNSLTVHGGIIINNTSISGVAPFNTAMTGAIAINGSTLSNSLIVSNNASGHAFQSFHVTGQFATNFGLANDGNFYMGGVSHVGALYKFITTRDGVPVTNVRLSLAGTGSATIGAGIQEPFAGAVLTGIAFEGPAVVYLQGRWRYLQYFTTQWFTVGYV